MTLWLVAVTPTFLPCLIKAADHLTAVERFPRSRRPLNCQNRLVEIPYNSHREIDGALFLKTGRTAPEERRGACASSKSLATGRRFPLTICSPTAWIDSSSTSMRTCVCAKTAVG